MLAALFLVLFLLFSVALLVLIRYPQITGEVTRALVHTALASLSLMSGLAWMIAVTVSVEKNNP